MSLDALFRSVLPDNQESLFDILMWARAMRTPTTNLAAWLDQRNIQAQDWFDLFQAHAAEGWLMDRLYTHAPPVECIQLMLDEKIPRATAEAFVDHLKVPPAVWSHVLNQESASGRRQQVLAWTPPASLPHLVRAALQGDEVPDLNQILSRVTWNLDEEDHQALLQRAVAQSPHPVAVAVLDAAARQDSSFLRPLMTATLAQGTVASVTHMEELLVARDPEPKSRKKPHRPDLIEGVIQAWAHQNWAVMDHVLPRLGSGLYAGCSLDNVLERISSEAYWHKHARISMDDLQAFRQRYPKESRANPLVGSVRHFLVELTKNQDFWAREAARPPSRRRRSGP